MGVFPSPFLNATTNISALLSGCAFLILILSMPILFTVMNSIEEELAESRALYNEMVDVMWKDLMSESNTIKRAARQTYKEKSEGAGAEGAVENGAGSGDGAQIESGGGAVNGQGGEKGTAASCAAGPKGSRGAPGQAGADGLPGQAGKNGLPGTVADVTGGLGCPPCPGGPPGAPGYKGPRGPRGSKGTKGPSGEAGNDGSPGEEGVDGEPGRPGEMGPTGERGEPGADSPGSAKGAPGPQGEMGPSGPEGDEGLPGERGNDAAHGPQGPPGPTGTPGEAGQDGFPGPPGKSGQNGPDAEYCQCPDRSKKGGASEASGRTDAAVARGPSEATVEQPYNPKSTVDVATASVGGSNTESAAVVVSQAAIEVPAAIKPHTAALGGTEKGPSAPKPGAVIGGREETYNGPPVAEAGLEGAQSPGPLTSDNVATASEEYPSKARAVDKKTLARALRRKLVLKA